MNPQKYTPEYVLSDKQLSNSSKIELINKYNNADLLQDSTIVSKSLQQSLIDNGLNDIAFPQDSKDKAGNTERALGIWTDVNTRIREKQKIDRRKLKPEEVEQIIDDVILDTAKKAGSSFWHWGGGWRSESVPMSSMTEGEKASAVIEFDGEEIKMENVLKGASIIHYQNPKNVLRPSENELRRIMNVIPINFDEAVKHRLLEAGIKNPTAAQKLNAWRSLLAEDAISKTKGVK